ncbi:hypothetical protein [Hominifimenecus sp. rT4P-3]|uniref:hypothetical protein n=1 Tax=Hominifimenecus sp. rT4P-3 TaxID=3242979 RepID=UPI003DA30F99
MGITIEFKDLTELKAFAKELLGTPQTASMPVPQPVVSQPVPVQQQAVPAPVPNPAPASTTPAPTLAPNPAPVVQTTAPSYTMDDLARASMGLMDAERQPYLLQLLSRFGVDSLPALPQEQYGAFATALRELGAKI